RDVLGADQGIANAEPARDVGTIAPYLVEAFLATSEQGMFASDCVVHAKWGRVALFRSSLTGQYGMGLIAPTNARRVVDCYQFSCLDMAVRTFIEHGSEPTRAVR
ncbi:MAG TPA: hypothetical protein VF386_14585, partial [Usitatibacter sp.]